MVSYEMGITRDNPLAAEAVLLLCLRENFEEYLYLKKGGRDLAATADSTL